MPARRQVHANVKYTDVGYGNARTNNPTTYNFLFGTGGTSVFYFGSRASSFPVERFLNLTATGPKLRANCWQARWSGRPGPI